jgi:2-dehydro-3-deoxyphosphogluconate aldolase/(4S)-4-hydroxy-2-oxoglutarate aldolase
MLQRLWGRTLKTVYRKEWHMDQKELFSKMEKCGVVPVIAIESEELALPMADALMRGGLPVAEITFRTEAAADVIALLKKERPGLFLGAGTITNVDQLLRARDCGAVFGVSPGLNPEVVGKAVEIGFPLFPGVLTPSEIEQGLSMGVSVLKYFPAEASGGIPMLKAVSAPYGHLGVRFIPTGGINIKNLADYLKMPQVLVCGGTWIAKKDVISSKGWDEIERNAAEVVDLVSKIRA